MIAEIVSQTITHTGMRRSRGSTTVGADAGVTAVMAPSVATAHARVPRRTSASGIDYPITPREGDAQRAVASPNRAGVWIASAATPLRAVRWSTMSAVPR